MLNRVFYFSGLVMAVVMIVVTVFLIIDRSRQVADVRSVFWRNVAYTTSQSDFELARLIDTLVQSRDADSAVGATEIGDRFEVALSRFIGLTEGRNREQIFVHDSARATVRNNVSVLETLEPDIVQFAVLNRDEQNALLAELRALSKKMHATTVNVATTDDVQKTEFYNKLVENARLEILLLGLVFLAGATAFANAYMERRRFVKLNQSLSDIVAERTRELEQSNRQLRDEITERTTTQERYRALIDLATDGIMVFDADTGQFVEANPRSAMLFGCPSDQLLGKLGPAHLSPEVQADGRRSDLASRGYIRDALEGDFPKFEWLHKDVDDKVFPCEVALARFPDVERNLIRASITDLTDRKDLEKQRLELQGQLAQSQKLEAIGQLTGGIAHDFNNLLNVVLGNLELLREQTDDVEDHDLIDAAIAATYRGADLTRKMLTFARQAHLDPTELDLSEIVQHMDNWITRTIPASIRVEKFLLPDLWRVEADRSMVESAVLNLLINARDAMPDGGVISLETANVVLDAPLDGGTGDDLEPGRYALLAVSDTGVGVSPDDLSRVFDPFFTTKGPAQGSGLGLSMVHGFMRQSGGGARIYSNLGIGTTIKLYFPVSQAANGKAPLANDESERIPIAAARILVAEDQEAVVELLVRILRNEGHEVVPARTGDQALEIFRNDQSFDLLVTC